MFLVLLAACLELSQGNHLNTSSGYLAVTYSTGCGNLLTGGKPCNCSSPSYHYFLVGFDFTSATPCPDGSGCMSQIKNAICTDPEQMALAYPPTINYLFQNISWDAATGLRCADGYYLHGFYPSGTGNTSAIAMASAQCRSQVNVSRNSVDTIYVPWSMTQTLCPTRYLATGISITKVGSSSSDLSDFGSLICSMPAPGICELPALPTNAQRQMYAPIDCNPPNFHTGCTYLDTCQPGFGTLVSSQPRNRTCNRNTGNFTVSSAAVACFNLDECSGRCLFSDQVSGGPCTTCSPNALCTDTFGGYTCACNPGYVGDGFNCTTKAYCSRSCGLGETPANATCNDCPRWNTNVPSSFEATCLLLSGNFTCGCPQGYRGANASAANLACSQINECTEGTDNCPRYPNATRIAGSRCIDAAPYPTQETTFYVCTCDPGFTNAPNCTDVDECNRTCANPTEASDSLTYGCNTCDLTKSSCVNNFGSPATCMCLPGFVVNATSGLCIDVDECASDPCGIGGGPSGLCLNLNNSFECLPIITNAVLLGTPNRSAPFNLTSTSQSVPDRVLITIKPPSSGKIQWDRSFSYGSASQAKAFLANCTQVNTTTYLCNMVSGGGANLTFSTTTCLNVSGWSMSCPTLTTLSYPFKFSYPPPLLNVGGMCVNGTCGNISVPFHSIVTLNGTYFSNAVALVKVSFGLTAGNNTCTVQTTTFTSITCIPESVFVGQNFRFWVSIGAQDGSAQTVAGTDRFNFSAASGASVVSIVPVNPLTAQNCTSVGRTLVNCPCAGGIDVRVTADSALTGAVSFQVDGALCPLVSFTEGTTSLVCTLPAGIGDLRPAGLTTDGTKAGPVEGLVSYQAPIITNILSSVCTQVPGQNRTLINCPRSGGGDITIVGKNFGKSGALVLTNFQNIPATHLTSLDGGPTDPAIGDGYLSFTLPSGIGTQTIIVFQRNGKGSTVLVTYSYQPCDKGTYVSGTSCLLCSPGSMSDILDALSCTNCSRGSAQPFPGQTQCGDCSPGKYANETGMANCTACDPGTKAPTLGSASCLLCERGSYAPSTGYSACVACSLGRSTNATGQSNCTDCPRGTAGYDCLACAPGKIAQNLAQSACESCAAGKYQNLTGQSQCFDCDPGTYTTISKTDVCSFCEAGLYASPDRQGCVKCSAGRFQNSSTTPRIDCVNCSAGTVAPSVGMTACAACEGGRFMIQEGGQMCVACDPGTYLPAEIPIKLACLACEPGTYSPVQGSAACTSCPPGNFQNATNSSLCMQCSPGSFTNTTGSTACNNCPQGFSQPVFGQSACTPCPAGRSAGDADCQLCLPGTFSASSGSQQCSLCNPGKTSAVGKTICSDCTGNTYANNYGQSPCTPCPSGSYPDKYLQACVCPVGSYSVPVRGADNFSSLSCTVCPGGYVCTQEGLTFEALREAPGYWRPPQVAGSYATTIYRCVNPDLCLGARQCRPNRIGPMCAVCAPDYKASGPAGPCEYCGNDLGATWGYTVGIILLVLFLLCVFYYIVLRVTSSQQAKLEKLANMKDERAIQDLEDLQNEFAVDDAYFEQERAYFSKGTNPGDEATSAEPETEPELSPDDLRRQTKAASDREKIARQGSSFKSPISVASTHGKTRVIRPGDKSVPDEFVNQGSTFRLKHLSMASRRAPNFMYKVKILVGFFQISSIMPLQGEIAWPTAWTTFISAFSILNFDFIPWQTLTCATKITYFGRAILVGCIPIAAILALVLFFYVPMYLRDLDGLADQLRKQHKRNARNRQFIRLLLFTVFLLYPFVSKVVLGVYNCTTVEGVSYLVADFGLHCFDSTWQAYAGICVLFVLMYPVGIPIAYYFILRRSFSQLHEPAVILQFGFLYEAYTDTRWFWELIDLVHKLVLTSVVIFASSTWILGLNMFIICLYLILILVCHPYIRKGDDRFHLLTQTELFLLALVGYIIQRDNIVFVDDPAMDALLSACLIILVLFLVLSFFVIAGRNVHKIWSHAKAKRQAKAMMAVAQKPVRPVLEKPAETPKPKPAPLEL